MIAPHEVPVIGKASEFASTFRNAIPVIETARLRMRAPKMEDFQAYAEIAEGPAGRFLAEVPDGAIGMDREDAWYDFTSMTATWFFRGHGLWSVETRDDRALLGFVLLGFEPGDHEPELGYMFLDAARGQGFAQEAGEAAKAHAFGTLGMTTLVSTIDAENAASCRLAERLGGQRDDAAEAAHDHKILVYRYAAPGAA